MIFKYEAIFRINMGKAIPAVGDLLNRINTHLSTDGYDEQLECHADIFTIEATVNRELTEEDKYKMKTILAAQVIEHMPNYDIRLVEFRRKSGNVLQSVS